MSTIPGTILATDDMGTGHVIFVSTDDNAPGLFAHGWIVDGEVTIAGDGFALAPGETPAQALDATRDDFLTWVGTEYLRRPVV